MTDLHDKLQDDDSAAEEEGAAPAYGLNDEIVQEIQDAIEREDAAFIHEKLEDLSRLIPRIPMAKGSGTFICILLNLENTMEEAAFIRNYQLLDKYTDLLFVNSKLEILTGDLHTIKYEGSTIDQIFRPMIEWQVSNRAL